MGRVVLLAGGGGHTGYAYALAQHLHKKVDLTILIPQGDDLTRQRLSKFGEPIELPKGRGASGASKTQFALKMLKSYFKSLRVVKQDSIVVSTGSNFSLPPCAAALFKDTKIVNIESSIRFTKASKTARLLYPLSSITALHWHEQRELFERGIVFGPLLSKPEHPITNDGSIVVTGGTLGHQQLFDAVMGSNLKNVVLQLGPHYTDELADIVKGSHSTWTVMAWTNEMPKYLAKAKAVITHFGMTALDAALLYGKPVIMSVNPEWKLTVGMSDAVMFAAKVGAGMLTEFKPDSVETAVEYAMPPRAVESGTEKLGNTIAAMSEEILNQR